MRPGGPLRAVPGLLPVAFIDDAKSSGSSSSLRALEDIVVSVAGFVFAAEILEEADEGLNAGARIAGGGLVEEDDAKGRIRLSKDAATRVTSFIGPAR